MQYKACPVEEIAYIFSEIFIFCCFIDKVMLRKFFIWLIRSLIALVLITFIFSTVALELPTLINGLFKDIFQYSSPEMQNEVIGKLTTACSGLDEKSFGTLQQIPNNPIPINFGKMDALCKDYNSGKVNDKEFFFGVIGNAFSEKLELPKVDALEKYNAIIDILNRNKMIYFVIIAVLLVSLYLLAMDIKLFIITLTGISFSIGIFILMPYVVIIGYDKLIGIDTTPILATILGSTISFDAKAIISVILLMVLRTYSSFILTLGILFFGIGIAGKVYSFMLKRKGKTAEIKPKKGATKEKAPKKDRFSGKQDKKDRENEKTIKEALDELEEMHKNNSKKD